MALKIKKKKINNPDNDFIEIPDISRASSLSEKGYGSYKNNVSVLLQQGYSKKEIIQNFQKYYLDDFLPTKELFSQVDDNDKFKLAEIVSIFDKINDILFSYLFDDVKTDKILKKDLSLVMKFFKSLLDNNKETLDDIKIYSAYQKNSDDKKTSLYSRYINELSLYFQQLEKNKSSTLSNIYSLFRSISFVSREILTEKNNFLISSFPKIERNNLYKPVFINNAGMMNYGHGLEIFSAMYRSKAQEIPLSKIKQFDIAEWNDFFQYNISEAEKMGIIDDENPFFDRMPSADLIETSSNTTNIIEVKNYSTNDRGNLNIYIHRPSQVQKKFQKITSYSELIIKINSKFYNSKYNGEALYDITLYDEDGIQSKTEISMTNYFSLFSSISDNIKQNITEDDFNNRTFQLMINNILFDIDFELKNDALTFEDFKEVDIFDNSKKTKKIKMFSMSFSQNEDFFTLLKSFGGVPLYDRDNSDKLLNEKKLTFNSSTKKQKLF
jgi:hypothetical protein